MAETLVKTIARAERLKSRKVIAALFKEGNSYVAYPFRVVWLESQLEGAPPAAISISVPKRHFKTAVMRNRLKRQIREAYRLHKQEFYEKLGSSNLHISLMMAYISKEPLPYAEIEAGIKKMIRKF